MEINIDAVSKAVQLNDRFQAAIKLLGDPSKILDNIMASMGDGLSIQDRDMRIVYQNKFMIDNFGSHIGDYCYNIYEKRSSACDGCPLIESFRTGQATKGLRVGITKNGVPFRFENIASVLRNDQGEIVAGIELCRIVEEREKAFDELKKATEKLRQTQNQLVRSEKLAGIGQLAAGVAHEINNPTGFVLSNLNTMREYVAEFFTYTELLEKIVTATPQGVQQQAQRIRDEVRNIIDNDDYSYLKNELPKIIEESLDGLQRIKAIVSSLLTFASSGEEGKCMVDVNTEIESALLLIEDEISKRGHAVKKLGSLPEIYGNPQQLEQMFVNFLLNATQSIKVGGTITVKTDVEGNYVSIEITDDGIGIPKDVVQNIFNPFFTTREVGKGVGLGLSIAYRIIENHNGNIAVQSEPGLGTTFTIRLPLDPPDGRTR